MIPLRVLVADDDPHMLAAVADTLVRNGCEVVRADSGAVLVDRLAHEGPFDLIVSDVSMPWMNGLKTLRTLRMAGVATPIVVMTALADESIPAQVRALSPAVLLRKPFDADAFDDAIAMLVPGAKNARQAPPG
jgi:two-component system chemotaxis response regulator CheY